MAFKKVKSKVRDRAIENGYKSGSEDAIASQILKRGLEVKYEDPKRKIEYVIPESKHKYTPDFILPNGIIIECKGRLVMADRKKHVLVSKQHPNLDIRFVFDNPNAKISPKSKTSYADWCNKNGFKFAKQRIPEEWFSEVIL